MDKKSHRDTEKKDKKEKKDRDKKDKDKKDKKDKDKKDKDKKKEKESTNESIDIKINDSNKEGDGKVCPIKLSDYEMGDTLGTGSFGRVKIAKDKKTGEYVAMKIMKKIEILKSKQADHIANEIKILSMIQHPFVITFSGLHKMKEIYI